LKEGGCLRIRELLRRECDLKKDKKLDEVLFLRWHKSAKKDRSEEKRIDLKKIRG